MTDRVTLYVSSDLRWFLADEWERLAPDLRQGDPDGTRTYRRADQAWMAWLSAAIASVGPRLPAMQAAEWQAITSIAAAQIPGLDLTACPPRGYAPPAKPKKTACLV